MPNSCFGGSGASNEKLFIRVLSRFRLVLGLWDAGSAHIMGSNVTQFASRHGLGVARGGVDQVFWWFGFEDDPCAMCLCVCVL